MFSIILKSFLKQGIRIKVIFIQIIVIFLAVNICFLIAYNSLKYKNVVYNFMDSNKDIRLNINTTESSLDQINKDYSAIYNNIIGNKFVQNAGTFIQYTTNSSTWIINNSENYSIKKIFIDIPGLLLYNFDVRNGSKLTQDLISKDNNLIPILVGYNLSNKLPLNSVFSAKDLINGHWTNIDLKVVGIIKKDELFWNEKQDESSILSNLNNSVIIPMAGAYSKILSNFDIRYTIGSNMVVRLKNESFKNNFIDYINNTYGKENRLIQFNTSRNFISQKNADNKTWLAIISSFALIWMLLAMIGLIGVVLSYIEQGYGKTDKLFLISSSPNHYRHLIIGELCSIFLSADVFSIIIYIVISKLFKSQLLPNAQILPFILSSLLSIVLGIITSLPPLAVISNKSNISLLKAK